MPVTAEDLSVPAAELTIVGHYDNAPGYATRRPAGSPSWLLLWTEAGAGFVAQGGASFEVRAGDLAVLGSGVPQYYRVLPGAERWRFWWVHFQPRPSWTAWLGPFARGDGCHLVGDVPVGVRGRMGLAFERALQDARWVPGAPLPDAYRPVAAPAAARVPAVVLAGPVRELVLGAVEEAIVLATASARPEGVRRPDEGDERVRRALALIAAEPGAAHSVASLARAVALSPSRFAHLFAAETGRSPMRAVREARVRHAASLLEVTDLDVGQVAAASGFVSPFHFSRAFSREYGMPPRDYRARRRPPS
ncbi:helix-turn-helix domain-containing protein [Nonomuraea jabiensis]|uniref:AraC family transcriptional regulator of arabinose operon n=1 Tax=Nonomuraea jabiensis TaxID=882448 RepID=A0A7W9GID9_9ACTN|nr:helix-turn-helix domain-containing protein [Nonomuraea jabiensis]MBB5784253.1 AraC family transcriptional regulator of arabinose operon [Nonomuraea jabiensis]